MKTNRISNRINPTLEELMATVSEFAFEYSADAREAYDLARVILVELLNGVALEGKITDRHFPGTVLLH